jgi:hypothetical protein
MEINKPGGPGLTTDLNNLNSRTPGGALAYCDYLMTKGYATAAQVNPWRTALQKVFETVEGEGWESLDLTSIDLGEYLSRFRTLAGAQYKAESITAYARRIHNALDAQDHFITTGRPPTFRQRGAKPKADDKDSESVVTIDAKQNAAASTAVASSAPAASGMTDFPYPLGDGRMVTLRLPTRIKGDDVNRLCAFIRTLQDDSPELRQLPRRTGEEDQQAA